MQQAVTKICFIGFPFHRNFSTTLDAQVWMHECCQVFAREKIVHPLTLEIAQLAGRIEGEQAARGNALALQDLLIGATALHIGFDVATINVRHFQAIPGLTVATL